MLRDDIEAAAQRISPYVRQTSIINLEPSAFGSQASITLKLESLQHTGSFKPRGAFNRLLSNTVPTSGVIAASGGNHGVAVAYAARELGHRAEIFVPTIASPVKIQRLRDYGAEVNVIGDVYADALAASQQRQQETGALVVHAYDQPEVLAGQGTTGRELEQQHPDLDTILVAVGGGGFIGGIAAWYAGKTRIVGVEPETSAALAAALKANEPVAVDVSGIAADSLGAKRVGEHMFPIAQQYVDHVALVTDQAIRQAQLSLWNELRVIAEPGGSTALAALLSGAYQPSEGERVGVIVCGANTDPATLFS